MALVIFKVPDVDTAVCHYHSTVLPLVVVPSPLEYRSICPDHHSLTVPLSIPEIAFVLGLFVLDPDLHGFGRVLVHDLTVAIRVAIFVCSYKLISICELDAA